MRVIIAGSRGVVDYDVVARAMTESGFVAKTILSGQARGADRLGEEWASRNGVPVEKYPADWGKHGRAAGVIRNALMVEKADALVAIWDGSSKGTAHVIRIAREKGLRVHVSVVGGERDA